MNLASPQDATSSSPQFDPLRNLNEMASLISEITGEPVPRVIERLEHERLHPGCTVAADFAQHGGPRYQWGEHLESFYSITNAFLYELAVWNRNSLKSRMRRWVSRRLSRQRRPLDVLSIGDGLGFDSLYFARKKHRVTYFELPGVSERFARRLFERSDADIAVLTDPPAIPLNSFDAITCFDVLEHVPDPPAFVKMLAAYLRPGGTLYVSAPFFMILPWYPTHLRSNRRFSGNLRMYKQAGLQLVDGRFAWYPVVLQKPDPASPVQARAGAWAVRFAAGFHWVGRLAAWPFLPVHLARRLCNRPFV